MDVLKIITVISVLVCAFSAFGSHLIFFNEEDYWRNSKEKQAKLYE